MATLQNDIPVATVDAARRGDEILPEHEKQWPATDFVCDTIKARYDGTSSTSHEIGLSLTTVKHGAYPGWRIEQIATTLGIHEFRRREVIERSRAQDENWKTARQRPGGAADALKRLPADTDNPVREMLREDLALIAKEQKEAMPVCEQCGQEFAIWFTARNGHLTRTKRCKACSYLNRAQSIKANWDAKHTDMPEALAGAPESPREPQTFSAPPVIAAPEVVRPESVTKAWTTERETPVAMEFTIEECDVPESFGDLPGAAIVFALLDRLPITGRWSGRERYRWLTAFTATLDLLIDDDRDDETLESEASR